MSISIHLASIWRSVFSGFLPTILVLLGIAAILIGIVAVYQTRRWPRQERRAAAVQSPTPSAGPAAPTAHQPSPVLRPSTTSGELRIVYPAIDEGHPDVWGIDAAMPVRVEADPAWRGRDLILRLSLHANGTVHEVGHTELDAEAQARLEVPFQGRGEHDLIAEILEAGHPLAQTVRNIRIVEYRNEIVETFDDFVSWAASHYDFVDRKMTAREFVDRYADGRPGVPIAPLERVVDLYELANYSEHPIDRGIYLEMVDTFLTLEEAGALDGPGEP